MRQLSCLALGLFMFACNGTSELPELRGKIQNYTPYPNSSFQLEVYYSCKSPSMVGPGNSCGYLKHAIQISESGSFTIPAMNLPAGVGYEYRLNIGFSRLAADGRLTGSGSWTLVDQMQETLAKFQTLTVFHLPEQKLIFRPGSGIASDDWAKTSGRDSRITLAFDFGQQIDSYNSYSSVRDGVSSESADSLPETLLFVPGDLAKDAPVKISGKLENTAIQKPGTRFEPLAKFEVSVPFSSILPESAKTFAFDDRDLVVPNRSIEGEWKSTLVFDEGYKPGSEHNLFDASLSARCVRGYVQGKLQLSARPANTRQFEGEVPVRGFCSAESGKLEFDFQFATHQPVQHLTIAYARIGAHGILLSSEPDQTDAATGAVYSSKLPIKADGNRVGSADFNRKR